MDTPRAGSLPTSTIQFGCVICAMPELAEVEWYRKQWNPGRGDQIVDLRLHARNRVFRGTNTRALQENMVGEQLLRSTTRGKRMLFQFSRGNWLGIHLGMTGRIRVGAADLRPDKHDHLVLYQRERALVFTDSRQFGRVRFDHGSDEPDWWKSDIPEIISREFDQKFVDQFLDRHGKAPIKAVLLMQNGFSGIGNWMADEILWRAKILPGEANQEINRTRARRDFPRGKIRRQEIAANPRRRFCRPAEELAHPSKMEAKWNLPATSHSLTPRNDWWAHDRLVPVLPKIIGRDKALVR